MSSCRQILGLLKTPLITIHKRLNALSAEKAAQQALLCAPSNNPQSSSSASTIMNSSSAPIFQNNIPRPLPTGAPCDPNAQVKEGYRRVTKQELENTFEKEAEGRPYSVY
jgi:hypothetical protein